jgi:hypothetical protein
MPHLDVQRPARRRPALLGVYIARWIVIAVLVALVVSLVLTRL